MPDSDLETTGGGSGLPKKIFQPNGPQFGPKIREARPPDPSPGSATVVYDKQFKTKGNKI